MKVYKLNGLKDCVVCSGKIRDFNAFLDFRAEFTKFLAKEGFDKQQTLILFLEKCLPLENYFFGFLLKLVENDQWKIKVVTNDFRIAKSFEEVKLDKTFDVLIKEML